VKRHGEVEAAATSREATIRLGVERGRRSRLSMACERSPPALLRTSPSTRQCPRKRNGVVGGQLVQSAVVKVAAAAVCVWSRVGR
jgi:hypothetical protein